MKKKVKISVRKLVQFSQRSGDLGTGSTASPHPMDAIIAHQIIQNSRGDDYQKEASVSHSIEKEKYNLEIRGRIDGVIDTPDELTVEEIKTTYQDLKEVIDAQNPLHWGQAKCYGYMYAVDKNFEKIKIQLAYHRLTTGETETTSIDFSFQDLKDFFDDLVSQYTLWLDKIIEWRKERNNSIVELGFPFNEYRKGQREMAVHVYRTIRDKQSLIVQAPTGIGKTMSAIFPSIKAFGEDLVNGIFYLTARTTGRHAALDSLDILRENGLKIKTLAQTAKEKTCPTTEMTCGNECPYAKGFYDRLQSGLNELFKRDKFDLCDITGIGETHKLCPHELSFELLPWMDIVICDYNYIFDPQANFRDVFESDISNFTLLIDEAHNLVDRARDSYSAEIRKQEFLDLNRSIKKELPEISRILKKINSLLLEKKRITEASNDVLTGKELPDNIIFQLKKFVDVVQQWLVLNKERDWKPELLDVFFKIITFLKIADLYDSNYSTIYKTSRQDLRIKLFCIDPSGLITNVLNDFNSAIFYSATLIPLNYFKDLYGLKEAGALNLPSPFPEENLRLVIAQNISTRYKDREKTNGAIASYLDRIIEYHEGNTIFYFPSYKYMETILDNFKKDYNNKKILTQTREMDETERNNFLNKFMDHHEDDIIGFAVMGGIFGEGIDLTGTALTGAVIVGVGLPGLSIERDLIMEYYNNRNGIGFEFAYLLPGINRVFQAVGRVIRSDKDRGLILLIDDRFASSRYRSLFPSHWKPVWIKTENALEHIIENFQNARTTLSES